MFSIVLVALLVLGCLSKEFDLNQDSDVLFKQFKEEFQKEYSSITEELRRKAIFKKKLEIIKEHNAKKLSYVMGINKFSDFDDSELNVMSEQMQRARKLGAKRIEAQIKQEPRESIKESIKTALPTDYSVCTSVAEFNYCGTNNIDQKTCGCCYAAGAAHYLSTIYAILTKENNGESKRKLLSVQQLIDCNNKWGGCGGGFAEDVLDSVSGVYLADDYEFVDGSVECESPEDCETYKHECKTPKSVCPIKFKTTTKYVHFSGKSWEELKELIYTKHGFITAMKVTPSLFNYAGGIYKSDTCSGRITDHVVVVDGYGECDGNRYLWVRNSWGNNWGIENGHFKIDFNTLCGINGKDVYENGSTLDNNLYVEMTLGEGDADVVYNEDDGAGGDNKDTVGCELRNEGGDSTDEAYNVFVLALTCLVFLLI